MRALLALLLALTPSVAFGHPADGSAIGFFEGLVHPFSGLDHILAMVAVGVLAATLGRRGLGGVPLAFLVAMLGGFVLTGAGIMFPLVEFGIAASGVVIGIVALRSRAMPLAAAAGLVAAFGVLHGQAHGVEMPAEASGLLYATGFLAASTLLHFGGVALGLAVETMRRRRALSAKR